MAAQHAVQALCAVTWLPVCLDKRCLHIRDGGTALLPQRFYSGQLIAFAGDPSQAAALHA